MSISGLQGAIAALRRHYPTIAFEEPEITAQTEIDGPKISQSLFPGVIYTDRDKVEISQELTRSVHIATNDEDDAKRSERLGSLNTHLSNRTTLLGVKPSVADVLLYLRMGPLVSDWSREQRTGAHGYHHIIRYLDFVQNSTLFGMNLSPEEKIGIDPEDVLFVPKPLDPKQEKERKRKEKAVKTGAESVESAGSSQIGLGQGQDFRAKAQREPAPALPESADTEKVALVDGHSTNHSKREKVKKEKGNKAPEQAAKDKPLSPSQIDLRVGHILKAVLHPNADSLFVSTIAVGDPPGTDNTSEYEGHVVRTVCSGLNGLVPLEEMQNRRVVTVCNLKPVTMRGIKSTAMVLAASPRVAEGEVDNHAGPVELVNPPSTADAGERVLFDGWDGEPEVMLNPKKKTWDMCQIGFATTEDLGVAFVKAKVEQLSGSAGEGKPDMGRLRTRSGGSCTVHSLKDAIVR